MKRSDERILTTHAGSLPRPDDLFATIRAEADGKPIDRKAYAARLTQAVAEVVKQQADCGLDIVDDGEFGKPNFVSYMNERLGGFEVRQRGPQTTPWAGSREHLAFPEFYSQAARPSPGAPTVIRHPGMTCVAPVVYKGQAAVQTDIANFKAALKGVKVVEAFMPAIAPSNIQNLNGNAYYKTEEEYVFALADAMREEYRAIVDAGFLLQIDDPHIVTYYVRHPELGTEACRKWAAMQVEALNHALRGIPAEKVRYHTCYGINMGPRVFDMPLEDILDIILKIKAGAFSFEASNPRHEHEWALWETYKLPAGAVLIPGVVTQSTVLVEHAQLVAQRLVRYAKLLGRENVIAGTDCGFATYAGSAEIHPTIAWAKLAAVVEGARLATKELWGR
jgi:5-methyltetrahydropteroyltriglutamate--homocysteine methyltransferase